MALSPLTNDRKLFSPTLLGAFTPANFFSLGDS